MKVHIGVGSKTDLTHSASITPANVHDSQELPNLLHGNETRLYGDSAYIGQKEVLNQIAPRAKDFTNKRASRNTPLTDADKETNRAFALLTLINLDKWGMPQTGITPNEPHQGEIFDENGSTF